MAQCLVVDHNCEERKSVLNLLGEYGFELIESNDTDAALKICRTRSPDVILMAEGSVRSRKDFIRRVHRASRGKHPVVLVYTADADTDAIGRAILDGAAEYLIKPFDRELLEFKLRQVGLL
jgi:two-component system chemotaxis response regulator CheY